METQPDLNDKPRVLGDQVGGDKILGGDIAGSVAAIGAGANVIYNKVERALTQIESLEQSQEYENKRLAEAITDYVKRLEMQAARANEDPGDGNPYKALLEFDIQDAALFYGRTIAIRELLAHIKRDQLTILHAGSGLGKTSLLKAGIMPRLLADGHLPLYLRPYQMPVHMAVKRALLIDLEDTPHLASVSLHDFLRKATNLMSGGQLVVIIDQFEELFTIQSEQARNEFIDQLCSCLDDDLLPVRWILGLRDEWFGQLGTFRPHIRNPYANEFLLRPLSRAEAALVITQPAARRKVSYESVLIERLMDDMGRDEIAPPHLQLVCSALFDSLNGQTEITQAMYEEAGEAKGILRGYLYRVLSRDMPPEMRAPAHRLLEALVTSEKRRALRTREELTVEMSTWGYTQTMVDQVINQLTDSRLLRVEEFKVDKVHSVPAYELAHDYLLEEIDLAPDVQSRKAAQELLDQKLPYYKREKLLLSQHELAIILPQRQGLNISTEAAQLLRESEAVVTRQQKLIRTGMATAIVLVISAIALIAILQSRSAVRYERVASTAMVAQAQAEMEENTAEAAKALAEKEANISKSRELATQVDLKKNLGKVIEAYQLAAQAYQTADTFESRSALYTALSLPLPERIISVPGDVAFSANFSPDGSRMVTAGSDKVARVWDVATSEQLFTLEGHENQVLFAAYSPDGTHIVTSSQDGTAKVWDAQSGNLLLTIPVEPKPDYVFSAMFSPDGRRIVTAENDFTAAVWEIGKGRQVARLKGHEKPVRFASFSPDGQRIVTASGDFNARVWDANTGAKLFILKGHTKRVREASFSPDGTRIVTASDDRTARVWDARTGDTLLILVPHNSWVMSANFSPDGRFVVTTSQDGLVRLWDASNGTLIGMYPGHTDQVNWANFSPDGKWIASAGNDSTVWLRETSRISGLPALIGHGGPVNSVTLSPDGTRLLTASTDKTSIIWDAQSMARLFTLKGHTMGVLFAVYSPDGSRIATAAGAGDPTVRVWNAVDGSELYSIPVSALGVNFNQSGSQFVTAGADGVGRVWDVLSGEEVLPALEGHLDRLDYASFSPDGTRIVTTGGPKDGTVKIWDAKTHELLSSWQIVPEDEVNSAVFSPDGTRLVIAADPNIAQVWDVEQGKMLFPLEGHETDISSASYSPDGQLIVTASEDHTIRLWDAMTGKPLAVLQGHIDQVNWAAFSPDGKTIYSASDDGTVRTWPVDIQDLYTFINEGLKKIQEK